MATSWSPILLNRYLAPGIAQFNEAKIEDLVVEGEQVQDWMVNHFLNNVFRAQFRGKHRQFAFNVIYRAQGCFEAYEDARASTEKFLSDVVPSRPKSRVYYRALRAWESCFLNLQVFADLVVRLSNTKVFEKDDGSPEQRSYAIANTIKHWGQIIAREEHHDDDTVPMWLTNTGFVTREVQLTYPELAGLLREVSLVANQLQDAKAWKNV